MLTTHFTRIGLLAVSNSLLNISRKIHFRNMGIPLAFGDNNSLWAGRRACKDFHLSRGLVIVYTKNLI